MLRFYFFVKWAYVFVVALSWCLLLKSILTLLGVDRDVAETFMVVSLATGIGMLAESFARRASVPRHSAQAPVRPMWPYER